MGNQILQYFKIGAKFCEIGPAHELTQILKVLFRNITGVRVAIDLNMDHQESSETNGFLVLILCNNTYLTKKIETNTITL